MLAIGVIGVFLCVASVMLFGHDVTNFIKDGHFVITTLGTSIRTWFPGIWSQIVQWSSSMPPGNMTVWAASMALAIPTSAVGLVIGFILVVIGFRVRRGY